VGDHPVKVPAELVKEWMAEFYGTPTFIGEVTTGLADRAAQWGADQELDACEEYLTRCAQWEPEDIEELRAARRPKPPTLAEQGMEALQLGKFPSTKPIKDLRAALNRLAELEANQ
jgi:hypothetical protein